MDTDSEDDNKVSLYSVLFLIHTRLFHYQRKPTLRTTTPKRKRIKMEVCDEPDDLVDVAELKPSALFSCEDLLGFYVCFIEFGHLAKN